MYREINANASAVISAIDRIGDLGEYTRLGQRLKDGVDPTQNRDFQRQYRKYWRMNAARLGDTFYTRYFALLRDCAACGDTDVGRIVRHLWNDNDGLQFSFATKLAHMVDPRLPVYDSFVAGFFFYNPPSNDRPLEDRVHHLMEFYAFLQREYARVLQLGLLSAAIVANSDASTPSDLTFRMSASSIGFYGRGYPCFVVEHTDEARRSTTRQH